MADPAPVASDAPPSSAPPQKPIHSLVLDTGPLIKNDPPVSVLLAKVEQLYTLPVIISEIRDAATRSRVETTLMPFVKVRSPRPDSLKFVQGFARKTGDLTVLSRPDLEVLALGYELECERNGGDWRLRNTPGQKRVNGRPPHAEADPSKGSGDATEETGDSVEPQGATETETQTIEGHADQEKAAEESLDNGIEKLHLEAPQQEEERVLDTETANLEATNIAHEAPPTADMADTTLVSGEKADETVAAEDQADADSDSDDDGWITPSNLKKHQAKDTNTAAPTQPAQKTLQAAVLTSDYAMQNVALRMNLNLLAPSLARITQLKSWILRCHGCFTTTRDMDRQFCPSCGQPTLLRTSCSTDANGEFKVHLKRNFQYNNRGNVYSVPKPAHGSSNTRRIAGGGKNGWGNSLVMAEDQKEYVRAGEEQRRARKKDLMDEDSLPGILTGNRTGSGGKLSVGAGRNVNSRRKR